MKVLGKTKRSRLVLRHITVASTYTLLLCATFMFGCGRSKTTVEQLGNSGFEKLDEGELDSAIALFNADIKKNPNIAKLYRGRGEAKGRKGNHAGALADFNEAVRLNPADAWNYLWRADIKVYMRDLRGSEADLDSAIVLFNADIKKNPNIGKLYYGRGQAKGRKKDHAGALADFNEAVRLNPADAFIYESRGRAKFYLGDFQGAIADCNEAIRLNPAKGMNYVYRAEAKKALGDFEGAIADCSKAISISPDDPYNFLNRALAKSAKFSMIILSNYEDYLQIGKLVDKAREGGDKLPAIITDPLGDFDKAIQLNPSEPNFYFERGNFKLSAFDNKGGIADLEHALRLDPEHLEAKAILSAALQLPERPKENQIQK